jgi:magnesium chelatase subunit H
MQRPAIETFFMKDGIADVVDAVVSLTGFSLVGGPAYNDARAAEDILKQARRAVSGRARGRVPDAASNGRSRLRSGLMPVESHDHGRDPRTRRRGTARWSMADAMSGRVRKIAAARDMQRAQRMSAQRADMLAARLVEKLMQSASRRARPAQGRDRTVQLPAECR